MATKRSKRGKAAKKTSAKKRAPVQKRRGAKRPVGAAKRARKVNAGAATKSSGRARGAPRATLPSPASGGLAEGDEVPPFELPDQDGNSVSSESLRGKSYVLYFYPKDDTPGCTKEACGFRDESGKLREKGVRVIGVSPDKPESHARFRDKYGLNFTLLSDADKKLVNACGVWVKKQNYGREYMGVERTTFLVGEDGKVKKAWRRVRVDGHAGDVLESA